MFNNKKTLFSAILIITILSISMTNVLGANDNTVYVSTTGNDANTGTSDSPFKTLHKAAEAIPDGGTILIKAGTYKDESDNRIVFYNSNNYVIKGDDPNTTILIGKTIQVGGHTSTELTHPTVTVQGLTFTGTAASSTGAGTSPLLSRGLATHINVNNCIFVDNNDTAIGGSSSYVTVVNSSFINNHGNFASFVGAIYVDCKSDISNCNFVNNTGKHAGAIYSHTGVGLVINDSSFSGNVATNHIYHDEGNDIYTVYTTWLNNCVFAPVPVGSPQSGTPSLGKADHYVAVYVINGVSV
ncbi:MAG: DUF1565 domain-containing protein [Methanobrevibacter sp.]|jgi:hypothetical protein|nr:DUF1565 domain-containing protein [Candidatus Methanovirga meridionalis]